MEAFEGQNDINECFLLNNEQLVNELEEKIYEVTGKNSKDKAYREKAKKIISRVKGSRNNTTRNLLKKGVITALDLCKLPDKQLDDDSYFENFLNKGNPVENKPKSKIKPPTLKNIPTQIIDLSSNLKDANEYFADNLNDSAAVPQQENQINQFNKINQLNLSRTENQNINDDNISHKNLTEIETNSVKTDTFSIVEDNREVVAETGRLSPKLTNGRVVQFNPPAKINKPLPSISNQTFDSGMNRVIIDSELNMNNPKENLSFTQETSKFSCQTKKDNLEKLKELMEKKKMAKSSRNELNVSINSNILNTQNNENVDLNEKSITDNRQNKDSENENYNIIDSSVRYEENTNIQIVEKISSICLTEEVSDKINESNITANQTNNIFDIPSHITQTKVVPNNGKLYKSLNVDINTNISNSSKPNKISIFDNEVKGKIELNEIEKPSDIQMVNNIEKNYQSPKNEKLVSEFNNSTIKTNTLSTSNSNTTNQSLMNIKEKIRNFNEVKSALETQVEIANNKNEVYEREINSLRRIVNELKLQLSKTNEESYKLEISRLNHILSCSQREKEILSKENEFLKQQARKMEEGIDGMLDENKKFRTETERKFLQYNKEMEILLMKQNNNNIREEKEENIDSNENFKAYKGKNHVTSENSNICTANKLNMIEINKEELVHQLINDNYDHNNFTNGSPNVVEEVGSDNYLNMNGNTYDEMKDRIEENDNLHDHQYYDSISNPTNANYNHVVDYTNVNKKANTGDTFNAHAHNVFSDSILIDAKKGESGASETNNVFTASEEEKEYEETIFEKKNLMKKQNFKDMNDHKNTTKIATNVIKNSKLNNKNNSNNTVNKKNIFEVNDAFDIFDKSDANENIFDSFASKGMNNENSSLFDP